ncbi:cytochrome c, partial [Sinorhizobium meliloti]
MFRLGIGFACFATSAFGLQPLGAAADDPAIARGEYLVTMGGCNDCHTPGYFFGKPDSSRFLGGSDVGFE